MRSLEEVETQLFKEIAVLKTRACEKSLAEFTRQAWDVIEPGTPLEWNWHLDVICAYLEATTTMDPTKRITRLIINVPPGTMKSILVSVMFPAWLWIKQPHKKVVGIANIQDLSIRDSRRTKQIVQDEWYQDQWPLPFKGDQSAKTNYENHAGGFRQSLGITANITGKRGNYLLLDDLHDASDVNSDIQRQAVLNIYDEKVSSRLNNQHVDVIILIMQRLHHMDITGHLLSKKKTKWTHVVIPMHYDSEFTYNATRDLGRPDLEDPRKEEGELLFPKMFSKDVVEKLEEDMGSHVAAGQLEQRPSVKGGGIMRQGWFRVFNKEDPLPVCDHIFISCDTAYSTKDMENNSYSAFTTWGVFWNPAQERDCVILLDVWYDRVDYPELRRKAHEMDNDKKPDVWLIEKKASGQSLIQDLRQSGLMVRTYQPDKDKVTRAYSIQAMLESGQVWIPDRKWAHKFTYFMSTFPTGVTESMDLADTLTQALIYIRNGWYVSHPDDEKWAPAEVKRTSAYGGHLADVDENRSFQSIDGIDPRDLLQ